MRSNFSVVLSVLFISVYSLVASPVPPQPDTYPIIVDTVSATVVLATNTDQFQVVHQSSSEWEIFVWLISPGKIEYTIDPTTITFHDSCNVVNGMSAADIFSRIAKATVARGVTLGYTPCPSSCSFPGSTAVSFSSCVLRSGMGSYTTFAAYGGGLFHGSYQYCCSGGTPSVALTGYTGDGCSESGCEITYDEGENFQ